MTTGGTLNRPHRKGLFSGVRPSLGILLAASLAVIAVACGGSAQSSVQLEDGQQLATVKVGNITKDVPVDGTLVFPNTATLKFESTGVIGNVNVEEGASVKAGDVLVTFDRLRIAQMEKRLAEGRVALTLAQSDLNILKLPNPRLVSQARAAVATAAIAADDAAERYEDLVNPKELQLSTAESAIAVALIELDDAEEDYDDLKNGQFPDDVVRDSRNTLTFAQSGIDAAQRTLNDANLEWEDKLRVAQEDMDDAFEAHLDLYRYWLGIELDEPEVGQDPDDLFAEWGLDLDANFDRANPAYATGYKPAQENPSTRWREFTIWAWVNLYPGYRSIMGTCEDTKVLGPSDRCVGREFDDDFDLFDAASDNLVTVRDGASKAIDSAQDAVTAAQDKVLDAQEDFDDITDGPEPGELLVAASRLGLAKAALEEAEEDLAEVIINVGPQDAARVQLALDAARERIGIQTDQNGSSNDNELDIELALAEKMLSESQLMAAQIQLRGAGKVHNQQLIAAEAAVETAQEIVTDLEEDVEGGLIRAPFDGIVAFLDAEDDDQVNDESRIAEIVDTSVAEVHGVIDASDIGLVAEGDIASVTFHELQGRTLTGIVMNVSRDPRTERGVVSFAVTVRVDVPSDFAIPVTLTPISTVIVSEQTGVLLVPRDAIAVDQPGAAPTVRVVRNGFIVVQKVVTGESHEGWTVIRSGLEQDEDVVVSGESASILQLGDSDRSGSG